MTTRPPGQNSPGDILCAASINGVETIHGGDTLAIRLQGDDGGEAAILMPTIMAVDLVRRISAEVEKWPAQRIRTTTRLQ